jgi:hypothetical protein
LPTTTLVSTTTVTTTTLTPTTTTTLPGHFQCYEIKPAAFQARTVTSQDQFGTTSLPLRYPHRLCAPANKNGEDPDAPADPSHLTGYALKAPKFVKIRDQLVRNQFGDLSIDVVRPDLFMVPSAKALQGTPSPLVPPILDHFACYKAKRARGAAKFVKQTVTVQDQFESVTLQLLRPTRLCAPASKNGESPSAPTHPTHLMCYKAKSTAPFGTNTVNVLNQFGQDAVTLIHRRELCVPSEKNPGAPTTTTTSTPPTTAAPTTVVPTTLEPTTTTTTLIGSASSAFLEALESTRD